jgi:hypothetical protein
MAPRLDYRCRLCSKRFSRDLDGPTAGLVVRSADPLALLAITVRTVQQHDTARATEIHECGNGTVGIADLIGGRYDPPRKTEDP